MKIKFPKRYANGVITGWRLKLYRGEKVTFFTFDNRFKKGTAIEPVEILNDGTEQEAGIGLTWRTEEDKAGRPIVTHTEKFKIEVPADPGAWPKLYINGVERDDILRILRSDGFDNIANWKNYWRDQAEQRSKKTLTGKIIHWTKLKYSDGNTKGSKKKTTAGDGEEEE